MRVFIGCLACAVYGWRIWDPKASYAAFFDAANWLTSFLLVGEGWAGVVRNAVNLILLDQADGFLLGIAFFALISAVFWPFRVCGRWCVARVQRLRLRRRGQPAEAAAPVEEAPVPEAAPAASHCEPSEDQAGALETGRRRYQF